MAHVLNFLVSRVTSEKKIVMQRYALLLSRLRTDHKQVTGGAENVDELYDRSAASIRSVKERIAREEQACREISDRIGALETRACDARNRIRNVRRRLYLKCALRKSETREVNVQKSFQNLFNLELRRQATNGQSTDTTTSRPDAHVSETTTSIRIKEICKLITSNAEEEKSPVNADFQAALNERVQNLMSSADILEIVHTLAALLDSAALKLRMATQTPDRVDRDLKMSVEQCLHKGRENHVTRFIECQRIRSEAARIRERRRALAEEFSSKWRMLGVCRTFQNPANPEIELPKSSSLVGSRIALENARTAVRKAMEDELCLRRKQLADAEEKAVELVRLKLDMETIEQEVARKQDLICRLVEHNTSSRHRLATKMVEMKKYSRECLLPYLSILEDQVNRNRGSMIREVQSFSAARLDGMRELVNSKGAIGEGSDYPFAEIGVVRRACHPIVTDLRARADIPQYLASENTLQALARVTHEGLRAQLVQRVYRDIWDFELLRAKQLATTHRLSVTDDRHNVDNDANSDVETCRIVGRDLVDSAEQIRGLVFDRETKVQAREVPKVAVKLEEGKEASKLCEEIGGLLREREELLKGRVGGMTLVEGRNFSDWITSSPHVI